MATRQRLSTATVVAGAIDLVNERGADALSLAELAARFRVRPPSLYNHVDGLDGLRREMTLEGLRRLTERLRTAAAGHAADADFELGFECQMAGVVHEHGLGQIGEDFAAAVGQGAVAFGHQGRAFPDAGVVD